MRPFEKKPADLAWYRCTTDKERPPYVHHLSELPSCKVFSESGLALMNTDLGHYESNAMLSFRSSPYGSTSHALANQNSFNTFYGGKAIFIAQVIVQDLQTIIVCMPIGIHVPTIQFW